MGAVVHFCRLPDFVETEIEGSGFRVGGGCDGGFLRVVGETRMMVVVVSSVGSIGGSGREHVGSDDTWSALSGGIGGIADGSCVGAVVGSVVGAVWAESV